MDQAMESDGRHDVDKQAVKVYISRMEKYKSRVILTRTS